MKCQSEEMLFLPFHTELDLRRKVDLDPPDGEHDDAARFDTHSVRVFHVVNANTVANDSF